MVTYIWINIASGNGLLPDGTKPLPGPIFCLLLRVSSDYAQPITGQVTEVTCPVIGRAQPELTSSKRQKTGPEPMSTYLWGSVAFTWKQIHSEWPSVQATILYNEFENYTFKITATSPRSQWVKLCSFSDHEAIYYMILDRWIFLKLILSRNHPQQGAFSPSPLMCMTKYLTLLSMLTRPMPYCTSWCPGSLFHQIIWSAVKIFNWH